jgi:hypothetical protein
LQTYNNSAVSYVSTVLRLVEQVLCFIGRQEEKDDSRSRLTANFPDSTESVDPPPSPPEELPMALAYDHHQHHMVAIKSMLCERDIC